MSASTIDSGRADRAAIERWESEGGRAVALESAPGARPDVRQEGRREPPPAGSRADEETRADVEARAMA